MKAQGHTTANQAEVTSSGAMPARVRALDLLKSITVSPEPFERTCRWGVPARPMRSLSAEWTSVTKSRPPSRPVTNRLAPSPPVSVSALPLRRASLRPVTLPLHPWPALPSNLARVPHTGCQQAAGAQDRLFSRSPAKAPCSAST